MSNKITMNRSARKPVTRSTPDRASLVAEVVAKVLAGKSAPGIRTQSTRDAYRKSDLDAMARDAGVSQANMDSRRAAEEDFERVLRGERGDPARDKVREEQRRERARSRGVIRKQFSEMRGRRITNQTVSRAMSLDDIIASNGNVRFGEVDTQHLIQSGVGDLITRWVGYLASTAEGDRPNGMRAASAAYDAGESDVLVRTLGEATAAAGGLTVPDVVAEDYIELLYAAVPFLQGNPVRMILTNGIATLPRLSGGASSTWLGENQNVTKTTQSFDAPRVSLKYLASLVPFSNRLARHSALNIAELVMEDMIQSAAVARDLALIRGAGTAYQPLGIENQCPAANKFNSTGTTVAQVTTDVAKANRLIEEANVPGLRKYWLMAPRTRWGLMSARDGNNNLVWAAEMAQGQFMGVPFGVTTNIPVNLGGGVNESKLYLIDMAGEVYAEGAGDDGMRFDSREDVAYHDGSSLVSAYSQDQTVARLIQSADLVSRHNGLNIAMIEALTLA